MTNHINTSASGPDDEAGANAQIWPLKIVLSLIAAMAGCAMGAIAALQLIEPFVPFLAASLGPMATLLLGWSGSPSPSLSPGGYAPSSRRSVTEPAQRGARLSRS